MTWDITTPTGNEAISNGDDRIRELKSDIQTALRGNTTDGLEAKFPGADTASPVFRYRGLKGTNAARPASGNYGLYVNTDRNSLQRDNGSSWEDIATLLPAGTKMIFYQAAAPTGWTKQTTQDDKALRVVSGVTGGTAGGTRSLTDSLAHTHSTPSHSHVLAAGNLQTGIIVTPLNVYEMFLLGSSLGIVANDGVINGSSDGQYRALSQSSAVDGSGTSGSALSDTLAYIDVIVCEKDAV